MSSMTIFFIFVAVLSFIFLLLNFLFAPHNPYQEKYSIFECGFHNFLGQNRTQFTITFFFFGIVYLILDLEIVLIYPFAVSIYENSIYGLIVTIGFIGIVTIGFILEIGKGALGIDTRQNNSISTSILHKKNIDKFHFLSLLAKKNANKFHLSPFVS